MNCQRGPVLNKNVATVARRWEKRITPYLDFPTLWRAWPQSVLNKLGVRRLVVAFPLQRRPNPKPPRHPGQTIRNPQTVLNKTPPNQKSRSVLNKTSRFQLPRPPQRLPGRFRPFWRTKATTSRRTPKVLNKTEFTRTRPVLTKTPRRDLRRNRAWENRCS